ncbi:MAG: cytochrome c family protein [Paracoccaceae bacterium]
MRSLLTAGFALAMLTPQAFAEGDAAKGEKAFNKCKACHMIKTADGDTIVKGGKTGPNLWGVVGRTAGTEDFKYSKYVIAAGEAGLVWDEEQFIAYVADPSKYLKTYLDDSKARAKMTFRLKKAEEAADVWAYLESVSPAVEGDDSGS